ncbi:ABC transporter permease [Pusillimonas sp.]|uniref:ABC transporter permease n=1 Tax=Pusillimonas sp. TaxID=3040095 RepID=UPI0037CB469D
MGHVKQLCSRHAPGFLFLIALAALWEFAAQRANSASFPGALQVLIALAHHGTDLVSEMATSLWRAAVGLLLGIVTMLPLGILIGRIKLLSDLFEPIFDFLRPLPALAIVPLAMIVAGVGSTAKILVIYYSVCFPIALSTIDAVKSAHPMLSNVARSLRLSRRETMWEIDLPEALPKIMVGIRIAVAMAILVSVSAEMLLSTDGIGYYIVRSQQQFQIALGLAAIVVIAVTALIVNGMFRWSEERLLSWHYMRQAAASKH